jgi:hypothetical protein
MHVGHGTAAAKIVAQKLYSATYMCDKTCASVTPRPVCMLLGLCHNLYHWVSMLQLVLETRGTKQKTSGGLEQELRCCCVCVCRLLDLVWGMSTRGMSVEESR